MTGSATNAIARICYKGKDNGSIVSPEEAELNGRLIATACTSYDKHRGIKAVECAEADLLGEALAVLGELVRLNSGLGYPQETMAPTLQAARAVLA